ncbi:MAG: fatty acid desaturase [Leptolyngbyaceae cyanobacterium MO_188.B28]|nr:fatty acid desaturase [Leptolyngbyaceae cyanobacterium MO_188.B28]
MSSDHQWHVERSKQILQDHPEIKQYFGPYPLSMIPIVCLIILHWSIAWMVKDLSWWMIGAISLLIGQFVLHSLSTFIHEVAHGLILKGKWGNAFSLVLIELGVLSLGKSLTYVGRHGKSHHRCLNNYSKDYEWWDRQQSQFRTSKPHLRLAEGLIHLLPGGVVMTDLIIDALCPAASRPIETSHKPAALNFLLMAESILLYAAAWYFISWQASLYLFWSLTLGVSYWGVTFKGQSIAEHNIYQTCKTYSTYQWTNILFFNTGYHDEHHTFANASWIHLPKIKKIAPEYFTNDNPYSYFHLWWRWAKSIFDPARFNRYTPEIITEKLNTE